MRSCARDLVTLLLQSERPLLQRSLISQLQPSGYVKGMGTINIEASPLLGGAWPLSLPVPARLAATGKCIVAALRVP